MEFEVKQEDVRIITNHDKVTSYKVIDAFIDFRLGDLHINILREINRLGAIDIKTLMDVLNMPLKQIKPVLDKMIEYRLIYAMKIVKEDKKSYFVYLLYTNAKHILSGEMHLSDINLLYTKNLYVRLFTAFKRKWMFENKFEQLNSNVKTSVVLDCINFRKIFEEDISKLNLKEKREYEIGEYELDLMFDKSYSPTYGKTNNKYLKSLMERYLKVYTKKAKKYDDYFDVFKDRDTLYYITSADLLMLDESFLKLLDTINSIDTNIKIKKVAMSLHKKHKFDDREVESYVAF